MTAPAAWPSGTSEARHPGDEHAGGQAPSVQVRPDQGPAGAVVGEMANLLRDTRGSMMTDAGLLCAITIGIALEAEIGARALHPSPAGVLSLGLLCGLLASWLAAVFLLARASRPVLNAVSELRWATGAPLDPRAGWLTLPPMGADPEEWTWNRAYLLLGAARLGRQRMQFADTWTYLTVGCFLAWTVLLILGQ